MQDKHKVTLYLPPELHRQLKIRSAVDAEPMSAIAERAIVFYLTHPGVVDEVEMSHGQTHRIYECPACTGSLVIRDGEAVAISEKQGILSDEGITVNAMHDERTGLDQPGEEELVPC